MRLIWSWNDKKHRVRLPANKWTRLTFIDDEDGKRHVGGHVAKETGALVQSQLYFGVPKACKTVSFRFGRVYPDGRKTDWTGYQDIETSDLKRTFNVAPVWLGTLKPDHSFVVECRPVGATVALGNRIYKAYE